MKLLAASTTAGYSGSDERSTLPTSPQTELITRSELEMGVAPAAEGSGSVRFDQSDSSVRFRFDLSNSSGSFDSARLAKDNNNNN